MFSNYSNKEFSILEGVMGFYDGMDKNSSAYDVTKLLNIPTIIILDASGSYITLSAIIKGLKEYRKDNTIKAVVFNHISSQGHYELIKNQIEAMQGKIKVDSFVNKGSTFTIFLRKWKK